MWKNKSQISLLFALIFIIEFYPAVKLTKQDLVLLQNKQFTYSGI